MSKRPSIKLVGLWGSYLGLFIGFIVSLQLKIVRLFFYGDLKESNCSWNPIQILNCSIIVIIIILIILFLGFIMGGLIHKNQLNKK